ncbi:MAG: hypothetical protein AAB875_03130, partial [Patescibacteria group bacterium]
MAAPYTGVIFEGMQQLKNMGVAFSKDEDYEPLDSRKLTELLPDDTPLPLQVGLNLLEFGTDIAVLSTLRNLAGQKILQRTLTDVEEKLVAAGHPEKKVKDFIKTIETVAEKSKLSPEQEIARRQKVSKLKAEAVKAEGGMPQDRLSLVRKFREDAP